MEAKADLTVNMSWRQQVLNEVDQPRGDLSVSGALASG
jgi:hypothetical protein